MTRPIIFSGAMVRKIIDGRKTQTRRVVTPGLCWESIGRGPLRPIVELCPYGQPGDRLWVREAFALTQFKKPAYKADARDQDGSYWASIASDPHGVSWHAPIHMPRWASRIMLELTKVAAWNQHPWRWILTFHRVLEPCPPED